MSKVKNPLFSMGAHGSLGDEISFRESRSRNIVEEKPRLPFFLTLPVQYQRWLYQDYVYQWNLLTPAQKQTYQSTGVRHHLTGFQYWMKYNLTFLPDIAAYWKFDSVSGAVAYDSSRNGNDGVIIGASPAAGLIDGGLYFDGLNDYLNFGTPASLNNVPVFTILCFVNFDLVRDFIRFLEKGQRNCTVYGNARVQFVINGTIAQGNSTSVALPIVGAWNALAITYDDLGDRKPHLYLNAVEPAYVAHVAADGTLISDAADPFLIGAHPLPKWFFPGYLDHVIYYTRILDQTELEIHAGRRWP